MFYVRTNTNLTSFSVDLAKRRKGTSHQPNSHAISAKCSRSSLKHCKYCKHEPEKEDKENQKESDNYKAIVKSCAGRGIKYVDEDFSATFHSITKSKPTQGSTRKDDGKFFKSVQTITSWERPANIRFAGDTSEWTLIRDPRPADICQGGLGNCWFIAALSLLAERKDLLSKVLISTDVNTAGVYCVRLFKDGNWKEVIVDDLLPCDSFHRLVFSSCQRKQLWVPLIEKAMAKLHGTYESLQSGNIWDGLNYLTGFVSERIFLKSEEDREFLWGRLLSFNSSGFLMGATITSSPSADSLYERRGLVTNHVYSILQVQSNEGYRLIQLRNPWGRFSWNGDWGDASTLWTDTLRKHLEPKQSNEGIFWMSYLDFLTYFSWLDVCKVRNNWKTYTLNGILPPCTDEDCQPYFEMVCKSPTCQVDITLYQSSKRNSRELVNLTDLGFLMLEQRDLEPNTSRNRLTPIELIKSERKRCVTTSVMLPQGNYCIVPFSFGHWTTDADGLDETFYAFTLVMHSSREIKCSAVRKPTLRHILADSLIACAPVFGERKQLGFEGKSHRDISLISVNLGVSRCTILENRSPSNVHLDMDSSKSENYISTRSNLVTNDYIPPYHSQVVQVLTAKDARKASKISNAYQLHAHDNDNHVKLADPDNLHHPKLHRRINGLHIPRRVVDCI